MLLPKEVRKRRDFDFHRQEGNTGWFNFVVEYEGVGDIDRAALESAVSRTADFYQTVKQRSHLEVEEVGSYSQRIWGNVWIAIETEDVTLIEEKADEIAQKLSDELGIAKVVVIAE